MAGIPKLKGIASLEILRQFQGDFLSLTGLHVDFCDAQAEFIAGAALRKRVCMGSGVSGDTRGLAQCRWSISKAIDKSNKTGKPVVFRCGSGLAEAVVPLIIRERIVGFAVTGQVRVRGGQSLPSFNFTRGPGSFSRSDKRLRGSVPEMDAGKLISAVRMLSTVANYIFKKENLLLTLSGEGAANYYTNRIIDKAVKYIRANRKSTTISLNEVAENLHISPFYFSHVFNKQMHTTFKDYLTGVRLEETVKMLKGDPEKSIKEIAIESGYDDPYYFCKVFKKAYRISPTRFRRQFL